MSSPADALPPDAARRLRRLRRAARRALVWENAAPLLWAPATCVAAFLAFALSGVSGRMPGTAHLAALTVFAAVFLWSVARLIRRRRIPDAAAVDRRVETDGGVGHRPLTALRDGVSGADPTAAALWAAHRAGCVAEIGRLRPARPRPDVAAADPWGLRHLALLLLVVTAVGSRGEWGARLAAALSPEPSAHFDSASGSEATLEAWLSPPEALGLPPIYLPARSAAEDAAPVAVPVGSRLTVRVSGGRGVPTLLVNGGEKRFAAVDESNFQIEETVRGGVRLAVTRRGATTAEWPISLIVDEPPEIDFEQPPTAGERGGLRLGYVAADDYGVVKARLRITPIFPENVAGTDRSDDDDDAAESQRMRGVVELPVNLSASRARDVRGTATFDLSAHLWAGLPAELTLTAEDAAGQTGESEPIAVVLPERRFVHPAAQALVIERRRLTLDGDRARPRAVATLENLIERPQDYRGDVPAFLAVVSAAGRLTYAPGPQATAEAQALMWEAALRIEDGGTSQAEKALRQAQQALAEALERGASDAELQALMERLQASMDAWLDALEQQMRQAAANGETPPPLPPELAARMTDRAELQSMMDRMRDMTQTGARDAAREMLSQFQQMMDRVQPGAPDRSATADRNRAFDLMRRLRELADKEQALQDETFQSANGVTSETDEQARRRAARERERESRRFRQTASPTMLRQAERQRELRRELGDAVRELSELTGEIPKPLGRAERAMRSAENALRGGDPDAAVDPQGEAVEALRQGLQDVAEQVMRQMTGAPTGAAPGPNGGPGGQAGGGSSGGRDPLGRLQPQGTGGMDTQNVKLPTESELQRARDILDELRRRAGEAARPAAEREYIERLLRRF